jgi:hypothetical protein
VKRYTKLTFIYLISAFAVFGQSYQGNQTLQIKPAKAAGCCGQVFAGETEVDWH